MATIGTFTTDRDGFLKGQIRTLNLDASVSMEPVTSDKEGAPPSGSTRATSSSGRAWAKTARESGRLYHQVRIDDPSLPAPIFANLVSDDETGNYALIWNRPKRPAKPAARRSQSRH